MKVDCEWLGENLESYFCDQLTTDEHRRALAHIQDCPACQAEVVALRNVDPLIKTYFRHELSLARAPRRMRAWLVPAGAATLGVILTAGVLLWTSAPASEPQALPAIAGAQPANGVPEPEAPKDSGNAAPLRAKPDALDQVSPPVNPAAPAYQSASEEFLVTDTAGYARTLADYRGYILLLGVWSANQPQSVSNLERLYQTFGSNARIRVLGVSNQRQTRPAGATFPIAFNNASRLFGANPGDLVMLDESGVVQLRGSLLNDPVTTAEALNAALK
jgi:hypothetical protein